jgi:hypothetical protein
MTAMSAPPTATLRWPPLPRPRHAPHLDAARLPCGCCASASWCWPAPPWCWSLAWRCPAFADLVLEVQRLNGPLLTGLRLHLASEPDRRTVDPLSFTLDGVQVRGRANLAGRPGAPPRTAVRLRVEAPSVQALDEQLEEIARTRGGQGSLDLDLAMTGRTPGSLAASGTGDVRLSMRDVRLAGRSSALDKDLQARLLAALVPGHGSGDNLLIQCVVAELPLRSGVAAIARSLALETSQIAVSSSGRLDLARQTVELEFRPRVKKGLDINPGSLVQLMLLSGPLEAPTLSIATLRLSPLAPLRASLGTIRRSNHIWSTREGPVNRRDMR